VNAAIPHELAGAVEARLADLSARRFTSRLWARDPTLWGDDPSRHAAIANRLGWLGAPATMAREAERFSTFAADAAAEGFTHAVLLGMGGSSLAPEVLRSSLGVVPGRLDLTVLDDTSPEAVRAVAAAHDPKRTLFVVSSKSGSTIEVTSFERHFHEWARAARGGQAGRAFVAITDPGTPLESLARERGYRDVFHGLPDVGGRYSAISPFGLVPAALIGADPAALAADAAAELAALAEGTAAGDVPGIRLGATLGELARHGRDKLTLVPDEPIASLGSWIEQLVAESTGKSGRGILPVVDEPGVEPGTCGHDRVFVALGGFERAPGVRATLGALAAAGHPVLSWPADPSTLGREFARWSVATATAAAVLEVNPFDEPNVTEAKRATQAVLEGWLVSGRFPDERPAGAFGALTAYAPAATADRVRGMLADPNDPGAWVTAAAALARPGDSIALLAYLHRTPSRHARLQRLRRALGSGGRTATTLGYGPRYLHSTGQLHKGGPDTGIFLQLTADPPDDAPIPGERFGFTTLHRAQAAGDHAALERRGRRLLRIHLGEDADAGLDALLEAVAAGRSL
jgi:glucose-6-phosphate isomerase